MGLYLAGNLHLDPEELNARLQDKRAALRFPKREIIALRGNLDKKDFRQLTRGTLLRSYWHL